MACRSWASQLSAAKSIGGEPLALRPAAGRQQLPGEIVGDIATGGVFQAELAGPLVALPSVVQGVAVPAGQPQREGQGAVGFDQGLGVPDLLGEPAGLQVQGDRPVQLSRVIQTGRQDAERPRLLGPSPDQRGRPRSPPRSAGWPPGGGRTPAAHGRGRRAHGHVRPTGPRRPAAAPPARRRPGRRHDPAPCVGGRPAGQEHRQPGPARRPGPPRSSACSSSPMARSVVPVKAVASAARVSRSTQSSPPVGPGQSPAPTAPGLAGSAGPPRQRRGRARRPSRPRPWPAGPGRARRPPPSGSASSAAGTAGDTPASSGRSVSAWA